jgi:Bacterial EndoU nuclease
MRLLRGWLLGLWIALPAAAQPAAAPCDHDLRRSCEQAAAVSPGRRFHILEGDARGGGHRPGRGIPNKSEFPNGWSDDRIIGMIEDVANDPNSIRRLEPDGRTVVTGRRQGVDIRVVIDRDGRSIVTGYPTNTPRNAR